MSVLRYTVWKCSEYCVLTNILAKQHLDIVKINRKEGKNNVLLSLAKSASSLSSLSSRSSRSSLCKMLSNLSSWLSFCELFDMISSCFSRRASSASRSYVILFSTGKHAHTAHAKATRLSLWRGSMLYLYMILARSRIQCAQYKNVIEKIKSI